jgi:hypothetical protein
LKGLLFDHELKFKGTAVFLVPKGGKDYTILVIVAKTIETLCCCYTARCRQCKYRERVPCSASIFGPTSNLSVGSSQSLDPPLGHKCSRTRSQHEADNQSSSAAVAAKHGVSNGRLLDAGGDIHIAVLDNEVNRQRKSVRDAASGAFPKLHLAKAGLDGINRFQVLQVVKLGNATG